MSPETTVFMAVSSICTATVLAVWVASGSQTHRARLLAEAHLALMKRLMEKFDTSEELIRFLQSPAGRQALDLMTIESSEIRSGRSRSLNEFILSIIFSIFIFVILLIVALPLYLIVPMDGWEGGLTSVLLLVIILASFGVGSFIASRFTRPGPKAAVKSISSDRTSLQQSI